MTPVLLTCTTLALIIAVSGFQLHPEEHNASRNAVTWWINNLEKIGGNPVTIIGNPQINDTYGKTAVLFDGTDDGLLVNSNPIASAHEFTVETVFRPDPNGNKEQRWLHIQEDAGDNRVLLDTRLTGNQWFLDTYIKSGENDRTLYAQNFKHPLGEWYHVALVYDGSEMHHYVNGKKELSGLLTFTPLGKGQTSIGVRMNRVYWFKGAVRSARFTLRALTPEEFMGKE